MKSISLSALCVTVAMAQTTRPVSQTSVATSTAAVAADQAYDVSMAPLAPVHDQLVFGNPALPSSIASLLVTPNTFHGKREAAFQWNGGSASAFTGTGIAVVDRYFAGFSAVGDSATSQGQLAAGYITPKLGIGLRMNFEKSGYSAEDVAVGQIQEFDSTYAPTGFGAFGSIPFRGMTAYGHFDWSTPETYASTITRTVAGTRTVASRSDSISLGAGLITPANGDNGISWKVGLDIGHSSYRPSGVSSSDEASDYFITQTGALGKTFSASGYILAAGLNQALEYANGRGDYVAPDWGFAVAFQPTLSTILPLFEHWYLKGGTGLATSYVRADVAVGEASRVVSRLKSSPPEAFVGVRYEHGRWAAEAAVVNGFLSRGPSFISGSTSETNDMLASLAITANFK